MFTIKIKTIYISFLDIIKYLDQLMHLSIFKHLKILCIKELLLEKEYIDNDITNIVCTKPNKTQECCKALTKIEKRKKDIFRISPRALVSCVLNKNLAMLQKIKELGYPLEMIIYASNYHLVQKRRLENIIKNV